MVSSDEQNFLILLKSKVFFSFGINAIYEPRNLVYPRYGVNLCLLTFLFSSMTHLELIFVCDTEYALEVLLFFAFVNPIVPTTFVERTIVLPLNHLFIFVK